MSELSDRELENRKLAKWLGWGEGHIFHDRDYSTCDRCLEPRTAPKCCVDFFTDESASALLLDRLASGYHLDEIRYGPEEMELTLRVVGKNGVDELAPKHGYETIIVAHQDRKTAIANAALALIEKDCAEKAGNGLLACCYSET